MRGWMLAVTAAAVLAAGSGCNEGNDPVLAKVGVKEIRGSDLIEQYRSISPEFRPDLSAPDSVMRFLQTVAQKDLLVAEARTRGLDKDPAILAQLDDQKKRVLLPELLKSVLDRMPEPPADQIAALQAALGYHYHLHVLMTTDRARIEEAYRELQTGKTFASIESGWQWDPQGAKSGDKGKLALDGFPEVLRSAILQLTPGSYSDIVEYGATQHIIYLEAREADALVDPAATAERAKTLWERDWRERAVNSFIEDQAARRNFKVEDQALAAIVARFMVADSARTWPEFTPEQRKAELIRWEGGGMTLGDFLARFESTPIFGRPKLTDLARTRSLFVQIAHEEVLLDEAEASGLAQRPDLERQLVRQEESALLDRVRTEITKDAKPTLEEKKAFYDANPDLMKVPAEQHVIAVVRPDSASAWASYLAIRNGLVDVREEARKNSIHPSKAQDGDLGWVSATSMPELQPRVAHTPVNRSVPPFEAPSLGGWAVLRVIEARGERIAPMEEMDDLLVQRTAEGAQERALAAWIEGKQDQIKTWPKRVAKLVIPAELLPGNQPAAGSDSTAGAAGGHEGHGH